MISHINQRWKKSYKNLPKIIRKTANKQYKLFKQDPSHPSLHFKKIHTTQPIYSARINQNYRTIGILTGDIIVWFWIGSHDDYDKLIQSI